MDDFSHLRMLRGGGERAQLTGRRCTLSGEPTRRHPGRGRGRL